MKKLFSKPLVSVIMPVYNGRHYVEAAIDSILSQTWQNFELLIVDDCSKDATWQILKSYKRKNLQKVRIFQLKKSLGPFGATNHALKFAQGKYIALMDSDDISHPTRLYKQIQYLKKNKDIIVLGSQVNIINEKGEFISKKIVPTAHEKIYKQFALVHPMIHPSCMVRRMLPNGELFQYKNRFGVNDDYFTFFHLLSLGKFVNLDECLLSYRIHFHNSSLNNLKEKFFNTLKIRIYAFKKLNYKFSAVDIFLISLQAFIVFMIPQQYIFTVYLYCRRINSPKINLKQFITNMKVFILKPAKYSFSFLFNFFS